MSAFYELVSTIQPLVNNMGAKGIAEVLWDAGYRLDPYPNGKSKDELIARIEEVEAERDRAFVDASNCRMMLERAAKRLMSFGADSADLLAFLTETSTVKS